MSAVRRKRKPPTTRKLVAASKALYRAVQAKRRASAIDNLDVVAAVGRERAVDRAVQALTYAALEYVEAAQKGGAS